MDVYESAPALRKQPAEETGRPPLIATGRKNEVVTTRRPQTRDISSRYKSPSRATPSSPRRCSSPTPTRTISTSSNLVPKRAQSVERNRPSTLSSARPSTPVRDSSVDVHFSSRRTVGSRLQESLWPSTMRSLSVSFQSDGVSVPVGKKEKPNTSTSDRTLRPTSNVAPKPAEPPTVHKPMPERMRSPLKGKNTSDHSENSKPVDGLHSRLIDQHRWPCSIGGKVSSNATNRSVDLADKSIRTLNSSVPRTGLSSLRRLSLLAETSKPVQKSTNDTVRNVSMVESDRTGNEVKSVNDNLLPVLRPLKLVSASQSGKIAPRTPSVGSQSLPTPRSRPSSPSKTSILSSSSARGISPSRSRPSTPPSRGVSPSRIRSTSLSSQSNSSISVLSFIADFRKGKRTTHIDDAHQLRLLYNRHLQWRFVNARAEDVLCIQTAAAEIAYLDDWALLEREIT
ncbi:AUGMIN subunit 8-like isoform X2 [Neltuma alba]|uniref:AUGMIN subunit 8-like isoform X2 n=1 Tax=Neltuma alba TaxID=207710 RepID=UPI0010A41A6C|nr:AUGMIN subunit 8-like isoform X2 [Prosopis alba]